jgi:hypothetical protein
VPPCRAADTHGGGSGLLVDAELTRAVRLESSVAVQYWWGVHPKTGWLWRQALGVDASQINRYWRAALHASAHLAHFAAHALQQSFF